MKGMFRKKMEDLEGCVVSDCGIPEATIRMLSGFGEECWMGQKRAYVLGMEIGVWAMSRGLR